MILHQKQLFSKQESIRIREYVRELKDRVVKTYHPDINNGDHDNEGGHNLADHIAWSSSNEYDWVSQRILNWVSSLNLDPKIDNLGWEFILQKYPPGYEFKPHIDHVLSSDNRTIIRERYYTILIQLSTPDEYSGGELFVDSNGTYKINSSIGTTCIFGPAQLHWVTKITDGERWSCTIFLEKDAIVKSIL